jgi:hypothetical protein
MAGEAGIPDPYPSPDARLGVERDLPGGVAGATGHPPVVPAPAVLGLQEDAEHGGISLVGELALRRVAGEGRVKRIVSNTTISTWFVEILAPARAKRFPIPSTNFRPRDLDAGIGLQDPASSV